MNAPLLSVIIPTYRRPQFLQQAIDSALQSAPDGSVEVIVVPNGGDEAWKEVAARFAGEPRVSWHPIAVGHANVARNHGLALARGELLRFLDDDDFFYPEAARRQCLALLASDADLCAAPVDMITAQGDYLSVYALPPEEDLAAAVLTSRRNTLTTAYVFRRASLAGTRWNERQPFNQDTRWMLDLVVQHELSWLRLPESVGVWRQHEGPRVSSDIGADARYRVVFGMLLDAARALQQQGRLNPVAAHAFAEGAWYCSHEAYYLAPLFWWRQKRKILALVPDYLPEGAAYVRARAVGVTPDLVDLVMPYWRRLKAMFRAIFR